MLLIFLPTHILPQLQALNIILSSLIIDIFLKKLLHSSGVVSTLTKYLTIKKAMPNTLPYGMGAGEFCYPSCNNLLIAGEGEVQGEIAESALKFLVLSNLYS